MLMYCYFIRPSRAARRAFYCQTTETAARQLKADENFLFDFAILSTTAFHRALTVVLQDSTPHTQHKPPVQVSCPPTKVIPHPHAPTKNPFSAKTRNCQANPLRFVFELTKCFSVLRSHYSFKNGLWKYNTLVNTGCINELVT